MKENFWLMITQGRCCALGISLGNTSQSALVKDKFTRNWERRGENSVQSLPGEGSWDWESVTELLQEKDEEIKVSKSNFTSVKSRIDEGSDDNIHFYSGIQNASSYREFVTFVLCHAESMSYWNRNLHGNLPDGDKDSTKTANVRTGHTNRALSKEDELFLTLARLRLGLPRQHIANFFNISIATVSREFTSWINLLYFVLGSINFWLPKHTFQETMPDSFRKFPLTTVILDATEFKIQPPSSLLR